MRVIGVVLLLLFAALAGVVFCDGVMDVPQFEAIAGNVESLDMVEEFDATRVAEYACLTCIQAAQAQYLASMDDTLQSRSANECADERRLEGHWYDDRTVTSRPLNCPTTTTQGNWARTGRFTGAPA